MGTKMAPTYATLVLGYLEHILYEQLLNSYGQEFASSKNGISILLLFMVKRIWSFKELSSV
jgi:hypothetical protein